MQITMEELTEIIIHAYLKGQRDLEKAIDTINNITKSVDKSLDSVTDTLKRKIKEPHKYEPLSSSNICKWCNNPWNSKIHGSFGGEPIPDQAVEVEDKEHKYEPERR